MKELYEKYLYMPAMMLTTLSLVYCVGRIVYSETFIEPVVWEKTIEREELNLSYHTLIYLIPVILTYLPFYQYFNALKSEISRESIFWMPIFRFKNEVLNKLHLPLSVLCLTLTPILVPYIIELEFPISVGVYTHCDRLFIFGVGCILSVFIYGTYELIYVIRKTLALFHSPKR